MSGLQSSVPAAIDGLRAYFGAIAASYPGGLTVIDGMASPGLAEQTGGNYVEIVGVRGGRQHGRDLGNLRREEVYSIECLLNVYAGGEAKDVAEPMRDKAWALLELVVQQISAPPAGWTLNGAVRFSELTDFDLTQGLTPRGGWAASIVFEIECQATLER